MLQGKELSYNNLLDLEAALAAVKEHDEVACVVIKHNTPCGVSLGKTPAEAFARARACDPVSAFGGIVALNRPVDAAAAKELTDLFLECVIAPGYDDAARAALAAKKNLRLLEAPRLAAPRASWTRRPEELRELRSIPGGLLVMDRDLGSIRREDCRVMTKRAPTEAEWSDLLFAWKVVKHVKSNAIVFAKDEADRRNRRRPDEPRRVGEDGAHEGAARARRLRRRRRTPSSRSRTASRRSSRRARPRSSSPADRSATPRSIEAADAADMAMVATGMRHFRH